MERIPPVKKAPPEIVAAETVTKQPQEPRVIKLADKTSVLQGVARQPVSTEKPLGAAMQQAGIVQTKPKEVVMGSDPVITRVIRSIIFLVVGFSIMTGIEVVRDWSSNRQNNRDITEAKAKLEVAEINAKAQSLEKKEVFVPPAIVSTGPDYDCRSVQSIRTGYYKDVVHSLDEVIGTPITGCMLLSSGSAADGLLDFSGNDFLIAIQKLGTDDFYRCPTTENPDCTVFFEKIQNLPEYQGKPVKVLVLKNGYVTITKKGA